MSTKSKVALAIALIFLSLAVIASGLKVRNSILCARFWPTGPYFYSVPVSEESKLVLSWNGFGKWDLHWGKVSYWDGWIDLGGGRKQEATLLMPSDSDITAYLWIDVMLVSDDWARTIEKARSGQLEGTLPPDEIAFLAQSGYYDAPIPVSTWEIAIDLPWAKDSGDLILYGPETRLDCRSGPANTVAFSDFKPVTREEVEARMKAYEEEMQRMIALGTPTPVPQ